MIRRLVLVFSFVVCGFTALSSSLPEQEEWVAVFAHGLGGDAEQRSFYEGYVCPLIGKNGPEVVEKQDRLDDEEICAGVVDQRMSCLGQDQDIAIVREQVAMHANKKIALAGVSKGAATLVNAAIGHADFLFLESPFASIEDVVKNIMRSMGRRKKDQGGWLSWFLGRGLETSTILPGFDCTARAAAQFLAFPGYDRAGISPLKATKERWPLVTNKEMVIVLLHSQEDALISINDSRRLYIQFRKLGFGNTYLIETPYGAHANVLWDHRNEQQIFAALPYIYQRHNLPFAVTMERRQSVEVVAMPEAELLAAIQPSIKEVEARILAAADSYCSSGK